MTILRHGASALLLFAATAVTNVSGFGISPALSFSSVMAPSFKAMEGVARCLVGYSGGLELNPTYQTIMDHTEAILIEYDPSAVTYQDILKKWKQEMGEPYPQKRQYRSAIFALDEAQEQAAKQFTQENFRYAKYVDIEPATRFYMAEEYHQDYIAKMRARF